MRQHRAVRVCLSVSRAVAYISSGYLIIAGLGYCRCTSLSRYGDNGIADRAQPQSLSHSLFSHASSSRRNAGSHRESHPSNRTHLVSPYNALWYNSTSNAQPAPNVTGRGSSVIGAHQSDSSTQKAGAPPPGSPSDNAGGRPHPHSPSNSKVCCTGPKYPRAPPASDRCSRVTPAVTAHFGASRGPTSPRSRM
ncbi:hypothetical protein NDU88_004346 [Pleurodeles waltl]|uniref:Uncharacterized protein n=1 Tax=Pleurodeles waltl TaxID=8319 RepID=A0AAV7V0Z7_PLEWA|nr:hypothetical protein NDU88_004346 [Pleurodeles waltl]